MKHAMSPLLQRAADTVQAHFERAGTDRYTYHDFTHTAAVVDAAREIGEASGLAKEDLEAVLLACYFHDVGVAGQYHDHEETSCRHAREFMEAARYTEERRDLVCDCIMATALSADPGTMPEKVAADADLVHLAKKDFCDRAELLRTEWRQVLGREYSDAEWMKEQLAFMKHVRYHTPYAQKHYQAKLEDNIAWLKKKRKKLKAAAEGEHGMKKNAGDKEIKLGRPDRGVETMFRTTARSHVDFSSMVDNKASIMITVNTLVVSLIVSVLLRKLDTNPWMVLPTIVFLGVCVLTIVFAVLASRPRVTEGRFSRDDIMKKKVNLLFFGNFYNMELEEFEWGMKELINDSDYLYSSMIRDFYYLGQVLGKKYRYMRISYNIFMYGLVIAIILYLAVFFAYDPQGLPL
jgi:predicted metal-dependent HD superfamily phosphohydrolase